MPGKEKKIRVLICDDSAFLRVTLRRIIESDPGIGVIDIARNGEEAIEKAIRLKPDVIAMDLHMPLVDGLTALKDIVRLKIAPVIMLSAVTTEAAPAAVEAMEAGAFDFIPKTDEIDSMDIHSAAIIRKIKQAAVSDIYGKMKMDVDDVNPPASSAAPPKSSAIGGQGFKAVALGLSTGGSLSIFKVLPQLPAGLNAAVIVVQHMPPAFISTFIQRLNRRTAMECVESEAGMRVESQKIYIAKGGYHLKLVQPPNSDIMIRQSKEPRHTFMPSVDVTMHSVCDIFGPDTIGVLMTGMGQDGADAMARITRVGGTTIAESEETAVVFGMPREAIKRGGVQHVVPNWAIAHEIIKAVHKSRKGTQRNTKTAGV
ncbi:MAG: chemotaxis-specific protein-glutamate methyltransferase CheB [Candidatus Aminicenantes bacterium]|nr:MAG: chemotaxis-specific protein-glutamate methyltransferase CheB [Candidatus Aminicenantes bacterium]